MSDQVFPLFADGPLKGQRHPLDEEMLPHGIDIIQEPDVDIIQGMGPADLTDPNATIPMFPVVHYQFRPFQILGHWLWIGRSGDLAVMLDDADQQALYEAITSERAREAEVTQP